MRTVLKVIMVISLVIILLSNSIPIFAQDTGSESAVFATDHILVKFKSGVSTIMSQSVCSLEGNSVIDQIDPLGVQVVRIPDGNVQESLEIYRNNSAVEYAEPDYIIEAIDTPNDPGYTNQWGLDKIQAPLAWDITRGRPDVVIAIIDSGIDLDHEDLASKIVASQNFSDETTADDLFHHGTAVAGTAAAITNNGKGIAGVACNVSLMNVKALNKTGKGSMTWAIDGIIWAVDNGANVINLSLGSEFSALSLQRAVDYAWSKGVIVVAAAGNDSIYNALNICT